MNGGGAKVLLGKPSSRRKAGSRPPRLLLTVAFLLKPS